MTKVTVSEKGDVAESTGILSRSSLVWGHRELWSHWCLFTLLRFLEKWSNIWGPWGFRMLSYSFETLFDRFLGGVSVMSYIEATALLCKYSSAVTWFQSPVPVGWYLPFPSSSLLARILFLHQSAVFSNFVTPVILQLRQFENCQTRNDNLLKLILSYYFYKDIFPLMLGWWSVFTVVCRE